jgi:hypothetical protein
VDARLGALTKLTIRIRTGSATTRATFDGFAKMPTPTMPPATTTTESKSPRLAAELRQQPTRRSAKAFALRSILVSSLRVFVPSWPAFSRFRGQLSVIVQKTLF